MSWDEKLFHWGLGRFQTLLGAKSPESVASAGEVKLDEVRLRLQTVACALAGRAVEVKEAEGLGGVVSDTLFLPASIDLFENQQKNIQTYLYRVAYSITADRLGFVLSESSRGDARAQLLESLLVVPEVRLELAAQFPGLLPVEQELMATELLRRNAHAAGTRSPPKKDDYDFLIANLLSGQRFDFLTQETTSLSFVNLSARNRGAAVQRLLGNFKSEVGLSSSQLLLRAPLFWGTLLSTNQSLHGALDPDVTEPPEAEQKGLPTGTEKKGKPRETVEAVKLGEQKDDENPLVHVFEKVQTVDDYTGGKKNLDGADELEEQLEALQELDMRQVIRTRERTDSIYKVDAMLETSAQDISEVETSGAPYSYDEWDFGMRAYKKNWCKVFIENTAKNVSPEDASVYVAEVRRRNSRQLRELRRQFEEFTYVRRWRSRQPDGPEIDLDAIVDRYAALKSGHSANRFLYLSQRPRERDFATLVLLDSSLSTDSWMRNRRVMDVLKESVLVLGDVIAEYQDRLAIGAFYSNTRQDCRYVEVKGFDENWTHCHPKLVGLHPTGYTRIGPALRHGTELLSRVTARKKLLLLISDGKPTDYDRYEGKYGIEDIRQAIREGAAQNITVKALAIEAQAKFYLPQMFGTGNFQILPHPEQLPRALAEIYGWLSV